MMKAVCTFVLLQIVGLQAYNGRVRGPVEIQAGTFLRVEGREFVYGSDNVFLSGTNPAWINYGNDFGNNQWEETTKDRWTEELEQIGNAGGNTARVWIHVEGDNNPEYDSDGFVVGTDAANTLISDLRKFLDVCQANGIFLIPTLWNGAEMRNDKTKDLFYDDDKLQSYLDNALIPMVRELKDHPALGAWEIMNEPEGSSPSGTVDPEPCFDTTHMDWAGPGWTGANIPIRRFLQFVNWCTAAIKREDPKALVTVGSFSPWPQTNPGIFDEDPVHKSAFNHYQDACLIKSGGYIDGVLDFWQIHTYPWEGNWGGGVPWTGLTADDYGMDGPLVIGEFPGQAYSLIHNGEELPDEITTPEMYEYLYVNGFNGGWIWFFGGDNTPEEDDDIMSGLLQLKDRTDHGVVEVVIQ